MDRKKLHEILDLAMDINETESDVFFEFHGHVDLCSVRVYENRWNMTNEPDYQKNIYCNSTWEETTLDEIIEDLKKIKEGKTDERKD